MLLGPTSRASDSVGLGDAAVKLTFLPVVMSATMH